MNNRGMRQEQRQSQQMAMTKSIYESLQILQLQHTELTQLVDTALGENPFLEMIDPSESEETSQYNNTRFTGSSDNNEDISYETSFKEYIIQQVNMEFQDPKERQIAMVLADNLDEKGYIVGDFVEFEPILKRLQNFEPSGIFARNLTECLAIQLKEQKLYDAKYELILANLELVAASEFKKLQGLINLSFDELKARIKQLRSLNPRPANSYSSQGENYNITPDLLLTINPEGFKIELNNRNFPRLNVNKEYYSQVKQKAANDEDKDYFQKNFQNATNLVKSLDQRNSTLVTLANSIFAKQTSFLQYGPSSIKSLTQEEIANDTGFAISTISRAVNHKYIQTPFGNFELKFFFSSKTKSEFADNDNMAANSVKKLIRDIIDSEPSNTAYSDDKLAEILALQGLKIARRTITKYREALNIEPSNVRKRKKKLEEMVR